MVSFASVSKRRQLVLMLRPRQCPDFRKWYADAMKFEPKKSDVHLAGLQAELEEIEKKVIRSSAKKRKPFESS